MWGGIQIPAAPLDWEANTLRGAVFTPTEKLRLLLSRL